MKTFLTHKPQITGPYKICALSCYLFSHIKNVNIDQMIGSFETFAVTIRSMFV